MNDQPQFQPGEIRGPETYSDEEIDRLGPAFVSAIEHAAPFDYTRLLCVSLEAARAQDRVALQASLRNAKSTEASLSGWCDRLGDRTNAKMKLLLEGFAGLVADIQAALGGELPGQEPPQDNDEGEDWKKRQ